ncbi:hypothetical protein [Microbacterium sp. HSID17254]|nr:hypothetical protein [Microbacterium sp. HSID17254]
MARYRNVVSGVIVSVPDEKELGSDWEREGDKPKRTSKTQSEK